MANRGILHDVSRFSVSADRLRGEGAESNEDRFRAQMDVRAREARVEIDAVRARAGDQVTDVSLIEGKVSGLQADLIALNDDVLAQAAQIEGLDGGLSGQGEAVSELRTDLTALQNAVSALTETVSAQADTIAAQAVVLDTLTTDIETQRAEIDDLVLRVATLETP